MIYLDTAATSLLKPETVAPAVLRAMGHMASPGRGGHVPAMEAAACCYRCREKAAKLFHVAEPERVVLTFNATHGLNIAIRSLVRPGARVLISGYEHNAVTRPLHALRARLSVVNTPLYQPEAFLREAEARIGRADAVVCTQVSNVFGYILPVRELAALCRAQGKPLIVDASQSAGVLPLDFEALGADFVAMPGHKGLMGPQGTGLLLCKNDARPLLYGGSGSDSRAQDMPDYLPDRLEAGTPNVCGVAGLSAALDWLLANGTEAVRTAEWARLRALAVPLAASGRLRLFDSGSEALQTGVLSVQPLAMDCDLFAQALAEAGVAVRSGLHCAPLAHLTAGTVERGTVRFSTSPFNSRLQMARAAEICEKILKKA